LWDRYPSLGTIITSDKCGALAVKSHQLSENDTKDRGPMQGRNAKERTTRKNKKLRRQHSPK